MMKKKILFSILTVSVLSIWTINASATGSTTSREEKLKVADAKVIFCETLAAPQNGVCVVTTGDNSLLVRGNILGVETIFQGGEVLVNDTGLIQYVGCSSSIGSIKAILPETRMY